MGEMKHADVKPNNALRQWGVYQALTAVDPPVATILAGKCCFSGKCRVSFLCQLTFQAGAMS